MNTRTISGVAGTITYTPQHQTATITAGGNTTQYIYDASGSLLIRKGPNGDTLYLPGQELNAVGNNIVPTRYYTCGSAVIAQRVGGTNGTSGTLTWLANDIQASAQLAINPVDGTVTRQRYLPFGAQRGTQTAPAGSQRAYLGRNYDPTVGLLQDGARMYDSNLGRFLTPDPIVTPQDPQNLNRYSYSANNPTTLSDPTGLNPYTCPDGSCSYGSGGSSGSRGCTSNCGGECTNDTTCTQDVIRKTDKANQMKADKLLQEYGSGPVCIAVGTQTYGTVGWCPATATGGTQPGPHEMAACHYARIDDCATVKDDADLATEIARRAYKGHHDENYQALHHSLWMVLMVLDGVPLHEIMAFARAHEADHGGFETQDSHIDMQNNYAGIAIGQYVMNHGSADEKLHITQLLIKAASPGGSGELFGIYLDIESRT